jgi:hypothetical protein
MLGEGLAVGGGDALAVDHAAAVKFLGGGALGPVDGGHGESPK